MTLTINGKGREIEETTIGSLLASLKVHPKMVVIEYNGEILQRDRYDVQELAEGDNIEIVQMMAGG